MTARIRETVALARHVAELAPDWRAYDPPEESFRPSSGNGMGWAEAARGRLVHSMQVEGDHVRRYRILAPTDWNFHPQGVMRAALGTVRGRSAAEAPGMVRWIVAALDPCAACHVTVRESFHA
jgi:coenzyme F420-reducing hydrogenase alpha subunit